MKYFVLLSSIFLFYSTKSQSPITYYHDCNATQTNFSACLGAAIEDVLKLLNNPSVESRLPSFDPLAVTNVTIPPSQQLNVNTKLYELQFFGLSNSSITNFTVNNNTQTINFDCYIPELAINFTFNTHGTAFLRYINISGNGSEVYNNSTFNVRAKYQKYSENSTSYVTITSADIYWIPTDNASFTFDIEEDISATRDSNNLLDKLWRLFDKNYQNRYNGALSNILTLYTNELLRDFPIY